LSESWAYREIIANLGGGDKPEQKEDPPLTGYTALLADALDKALEVIGRSGRDVLYGILDARYGLKPVDIPEKTGQYMSALRDILGSSATVVEKYALSHIKDKTGVDAHTMEEAVEKLKTMYPDE
jgi:hypothetical protein